MVTESGKEAAGLARTAVSNSPEDTRRLASRLGGLCSGGEVILLRGDLGAGKTCFVQGLAAGLGVGRESAVTSPTFVLHAEYQGRLVLNHLDLYRLEVPAALDGLGIWDILSDPGAVAAVEWPELLEGGLRGGRLELRIDPIEADSRLFSGLARGARHARLLASWLDRPGSDRYTPEDGAERRNPPLHP